MIRFYKILATLILAAIAIINGSAQNSHIHKGDEEFLHKNYVKAASYYQKALKSAKGSLMSEAASKTADCYRLMNEFDHAIGYYLIYANSTAKPDKDILFNYATLLLKTGDVNESKDQFIKLQEVYPDDSEIARMVKCCNFALLEIAKDNQPEITNQEALNSDKSEFGLAWFEGQLVFASKRLVNDYSSIHGRTNQGFSDLYSASFDDVYNVYNNPIRLDDHINSDYNDGTFAYHQNSSTAYFTQCKKSPEKCQIFKGTYDDGKWIDVDPLPFRQPEYDFAHPSITSDGQTLYFVSDMPGGEGGKDIWKAKISDDGTILNVKNLGEPVNTPKDEMFPYILGDSILLFSSDGHVGMGGLDIFYSKSEYNYFTKPVNPGSPINSTYDDFSILFNEDLNGGYFCSNRENSTKSDDIYTFDYNIFHSGLKGIVNDSVKLFPLSNVKITYYTDNEIIAVTHSDLEGNFSIPYISHNRCGKSHKLVFEKDGYIRKVVGINCDLQEPMLVLLWDGEIISNTLAGKVSNKQNSEPLEGVQVVITSAKGANESITTDIDGMYVSTNILSNDIYNIRASKDGFLSESKKIVVPESNESMTITKVTGFDTDFELIPIVLKSEFRIDNIYYEFDKATLLEKSKTELGKLINILTENPNITIRINSHTDSRGSNKYNQKLSDRRGASVVSYLIAQGVHKDRLFSRGYGETMLLIKNAKTDEEHQFNRRTTFEIIGTTFHSTVVNAGLEMEKAIQEKYSTPAPVSKKEKSVPINNKKRLAAGNGAPVFGVQIFATSKKVDVKSELKNISDLIEKYQLNIVKSGQLNKYQLGPIGVRTEATRIKELLISKGYVGSFLIPMDK